MSPSIFAVPPSICSIKEDILLRIVDIVKEAGTGFALPSQTAYLGRDKGIDAERMSDSEAQVEGLRPEGER